MEAVKEKSAPQEMQLGGRDSERIAVFARRRSRTQMRRRYFLRFPVRVWPPGAAPTSV